MLLTQFFSWKNLTSFLIFPWSSSIGTNSQCKKLVPPAKDAKKHNNKKTNYIWNYKKKSIYYNVRAYIHWKIKIKKKQENPKKLEHYPALCLFSCEWACHWLLLTWEHYSIHQLTFKVAAPGYTRHRIYIM